MNVKFLGDFLKVAAGAVGEKKADTPAVPQFVTDSVNLANDAMTWLLLISAAVAVVIGGWFIFKWYQAEENEKPAAMKRVKGVVIGAVGVIIFEAVVKLIVSYYTH